MIIIELAHCAAGAEGGNHVSAGREHRSSNATHTHSMLLIVHGITTPSRKSQVF